MSIPWAAPDTPFLGCRNSYSLYCAELMANMKDVPSTERMVLCSQQWKLLSQKEKDAYHKKCDQVGSGEKGQEEFGVGRSPPPPAFLGAGPRCPQSVPSLGCVHVGAARGGWGMLVVLLLGGGSASTRGSNRAGGRSLHNPVSPPLPPQKKKDYEIELLRFLEVSTGGWRPQNRGSSAWGEGGSCSTLKGVP